MGANDEPLDGVGAFQDRRLGEDVDAGELGDVGRVIRRAGGEPGHQSLVEPAVGAEAHAAGVLHRAQAFPHDQALLGEREVDAPANLFAREPVIIAIRVEAEQREVEAVLAARRAVACARVAAGLHEHRHHVELETDWLCVAAPVMLTGTVSVRPL